MSIGWKIAFVTVSSVSVATIAAFIYGVLVFFGAFAPALPPMPDWKTPYEAALAEGDCATASSVLIDADRSHVIEARLIGVELLDDPLCLDTDDWMEQITLSIWAADIDDVRARFEKSGEHHNSTLLPLDWLNRNELIELLARGRSGFSLRTTPVLSTRLFALKMSCINPISAIGVRDRDRLRRTLAERATGEKPPPSHVVSRLERCADKAGRLAAAFKTRARTDDQRRFAFQLYMTAIFNGGGPEARHQRAVWMLGGLRGDPEHSLSGVPSSYFDEYRAFRDLYQMAMKGYGPALRDLLAYIDDFPQDRLDEIDLQICFTYEDLTRLIRSGDRPDLEAYTDDLGSWLIEMRGEPYQQGCEPKD